MNAVVHAKAESRHLLSGNEAVARAAWEAGVRVAAAYPGTPATEILENIALYPDIYSEWSVNEKVAVEVAIGASLAGSRALAAMKHVGMNVASDAFMTQSLAGVVGGLVIVVADDVGLSSSQNEQDSRYWGRFGHMPVLEPADSQEAYEMVKQAFALSEQYEVPVIVRMTTRVCHVKAMVTVAGQRTEHAAAGFQKNPQRWVMTPANAKPRLPVMHQRERQLQILSETSDLNLSFAGSDRRIGFVTSGPAFMHVRETFPNVRSTSNAYGLTESSSVATILSGGSAVDKVDSVGRPMPVVDIAIADPTGTHLGPGQTGEVLIRGPIIMAGYWDNPEATANTIRDGWLHTGDVGHLDDDGYLFITDRAKDMLIRGGENVYCVEIENRLVEHPEIADAAVVGVPHPELGEEVKAVLELTDGATITDDDVRSWVAETLAAFKVPTYVERRHEKLPRNASGKLLKNVLRGEGHVSFAETM